MSLQEPSHAEFSQLPIDADFELVGLRLDQAAELFDVVDNNREHLGRFLPWVEKTTSVSDSEQFIATTIQERLWRDVFGFGIIKGGSLIGHISLMNVSLPDDIKMSEIGYWITGDASGLGVTTRAARRVTQFGLDDLGLERVLIRADARNIPSNRVAEKLGYRLEFQKEDPEYGNKVTNFWIIGTPLPTV